MKEILKHKITIRHPIIAAIAVLAIAALANAMLYFNAGLYTAVVIAGIAVLYHVFKDYTHGIVLICFLIPLDTATEITAGLTVTKVLGGITFLSFLPAMRHCRYKTTGYFLTAFILYSALSTLWAIDKAEAINRTFNLVNYYVFVLMVINIKKPQTLKQCVIAYVLGSIVLSALGLYNFIAHGGTERAAAFAGEDMNFFGLTLGIAVICNCYMMKENRKLKIIAVLACPVLIGGQIVSLSRTAWVATCIGLIAFFSGSGMSIKKVSRTAASVSAFLALAFIAVKKSMPSLTGMLVERFNSIFTLSDKASGRLDIWTVAFDIFKDRPLFGVGINNFPAAFSYGYLINSTASAYIGTNRDPHNLYISILVELGIFGMCIFAFVLVKVFRNVFFIRKENGRDFCFALFIFAVAAGLANTILYKKYFWFILSLIYAIADHDKSGGEIQIHAAKWRLKRKRDDKTNSSFTYVSK